MHRRVTAGQLAANTVYTCVMNFPTDADHLPLSPISPKSSVRRWLQPVLVITISLLLHLIFFDWLGGRHPKALPTPLVEQVIVAALLPPVTPITIPDAAKPASAPPPPKRIAPPRAPVKVARAAPVGEAAEVKSLDAALPLEPPPQMEASAQADTTPASAVAAAEAIAAPTALPAASPATPAPAPARRFAPPPSAEVKYDVQALRDGRTVYGSGKISWKTTGGTYEIDGEAGVLFFSVLTFKSEGSIDEQGITPLRYSEKRFHKSETNTHFQREPKRISFSASTLQYPRNGGEQDRASIIWQLVALGRADPAQFGDGLDIFVAGVRDGDTWHVQVLGQEQITVGGASINAWHLLRTPRAGSFDTQVDIWLAPTRDWYPVKLRQTERNGDYLDMSMSSITALSPQ